MNQRGYSHWKATVFRKILVRKKRATYEVNIRITYWKSFKRGVPKEERYL
jgi:hypothetical protein